MKRSLSGVDKILAVWAFLMCAASACTSQIAPVTSPELLQQIAFAAPGVATRGDIEDQLGPPTYEYEGGRITAYELEISSNHQLIRSPQNLAPYELVLVFGRGDVLARRSLVGR